MLSDGLGAAIFMYPMFWTVNGVAKKHIMFVCQGFVTNGT